MARKVIDIRKTISAPPDVVYRLIDDSSTWPDWTAIESYRQIEPPGPDGLGEVRSFRTGNVRVQEMVVERIPGRRLSYALLSGLAVKEYVAEIDLEPAPGGTSVRWHTTFRPRFPGTGWIYRSGLRQATQNFVDGLAEHAVEVSARLVPPGRVV